MSLATAGGHYAAGLETLRASLDRTGFDGEIVFWPPGSFPEDCPPHDEVPFAFKPACFREAQKRGMELVLWLDAGCVVVRGLDPLFEAIERRGYVLFRNWRHRVGEWASDEALAVLDVTRDEAMRIPEVNAAALGLDLRSEIAGTFLDEWLRYARDGTAFRGTRDPLRGPRDYHDLKWNHRNRASADPRVSGHRHDQTVAGALARRLGMRLTNRGLAPYSPARRRIGPRTVIVVDRNSGRPETPSDTVARIRRDRYLGYAADCVPRVTRR